MSNYTAFFAPHYINETDPDKLVEAFEMILGEKIERCISYHDGNHYSKDGLIQGYFIGGGDDPPVSLYDVFFREGYTIEVYNKRSKFDYDIGPHFIGIHANCGSPYYTLMDAYFGIPKCQAELVNDPKFLKQMNATLEGFEEIVLPFYVNEAKRLGLKRLYVGSEYYEVHFEKDDWFIEPTEEQLLNYIKQENIPFFVYGEKPPHVDRDENTDDFPIIQVNF